MTTTVYSIIENLRLYENICPPAHISTNSLYAAVLWTIPCSCFSVPSLDYRTDPPVPAILLLTSVPLNRSKRHLASVNSHVSLQTTQL
jgi:hypothetical protein